MAGFLPPTPQIQVDTNVWAVKYWFDKMQKWAKGTSQVKPIIITSNYTVTPDESFYGYIVDTTAGSVVLSLPPAAGAIGKKFFVKMLVTNAICVVNPFTGDTIDGAASVILTTANDWVEIVSDGVSKWWIISRNSIANSTYTLVNTTVAPGGTNQLTISGIPTTGQDLIISFNGKSDSGAVGDVSIYLQLNGDTTVGNYSTTTYILGSGAAASSSTIAPTGNGGQILYGPGSAFTTGNLGGGEILIPGYANTAFNFKMIQSLSAQRHQAGALFVACRSFEWQSFAAPISQLKFTIATGNYVAGSTFNVFKRG